METHNHSVLSRKVSQKLQKWKTTSAYNSLSQEPESKATLCTDSPKLNRLETDQLTLCLIFSCPVLMTQVTTASAIAVL